MNKQQELSAKLSAEFQPHFLIIENESHLHRSGKGGDSHFKVVIVSDNFEGLRQVVRHRLIYRLLAQDIENGIHALALHTYTLSEWRQVGGVFPESPNCAGVGH